MNIFSWRIHFAASRWHLLNNMLTDILTQNQFPLYFVNCIPSVSKETKANIGRALERVSSVRATCPQHDLTWSWSRADYCQPTLLLRKSASVSFTWFTPSTSSGLLVSSDKIQSEHHAKNCMQPAVLSVPFDLKLLLLKPFSDVFPLGLLKRVASQPASWIVFYSWTGPAQRLNLNLKTYLHTSKQQREGRGEAATDCGGFTDNIPAHSNTHPTVWVFF